MSDKTRDFIVTSEYGEVLNALNVNAMNWVNEFQGNRKEMIRGIDNGISAFNNHIETLRSPETLDIEVFDITIEALCKIFERCPVSIRIAIDSLLMEGKVGVAEMLLEILIELENDGKIPRGPINFEKVSAVKLDNALDDILFKAVK